MKQKRLMGVLCAGVFSLGLASTVDAALVGVLPATSGGTDWQAYYDDQLDITWTANANINGAHSWDDQIAWAAGLNISGVTDWRLPSVDVNGDNFVVTCTVDQVACQDNEYGHLYNYGAGTSFGGGITPGTPGPFSNVQADNYWYGAEYVLDTDQVWNFFFNTGSQGLNLKGFGVFAWAVHSGNVSAVPLPAAVWLFGLGLMGLLSAAKRK